MRLKRFAPLLVVCLLLVAVGTLASGAGVLTGKAPVARRLSEAGRAAAFLPGVSPGNPVTRASQLQPVVAQAERSDVSRPLRQIPIVAPVYDPNRPIEVHTPLKKGSGGTVTDSVAQRVFGPFVMPTPIQSFEGMNNLWGSYPPDTNGEVGPNNYVQQVNNGFEIWNKTGTPLYGPASFNTLFTGFGGPCELRNDGDPVVVYDQLADRWLLTSFTIVSPYKQCIAISTSGDPTGSYYRYSFAETTFEDYPHFGVWPDAYYMSANDSGSTHFAFERDRMLVGDPTAREITFHLSSDSALLPADLDGYTPPPAGSPNYYLDWYNSSPGQVAEYKYHVDWTTPANSTFTGPTLISVADFDPNVGGIEQPGTSVLLDDLSDRIMFRVAYRNFGDHESLVTNHTVRDTGTGQAAIRWYEIRSPGTTPTLYQQGTYAPDATNRWMGSVAMDHMGNLAVGFSASSTTIYPSIRYAGRLASDPLGELAQGEATLFNGTGSQTGPEARWGDYSDITVDPTDDCTFWYTTEYIQVTGLRTWRTRIGSFKFPSCTAAPPTATVTGTPPTATPTHTPTNTPTATPTLCPAGASYTGSITNSDPTQAGAINYRLPVSTCSTPKTCASLLDTLARHYDSYSFTNTSGSSECVTVHMVASCSNNALWSMAYLGSFNPNSLCTNYVADGGRSGPVTDYSFTLANGVTAVVVVNEVNPNIGCESYTLTISPCSTAGGPTSTPTPTSPPGTDTVTRTSTPSNITNTPVSTSTSTAGVGSPTVTSTPCTISFSDVQPSDYFYEDVRCVYCLGAVSGYQDGTFRPFNNTTRGQMTKIIVLALQIAIVTPTGTPTFNDVPPTDPFYQYIETAAANGIVSGYADGTFRPNTFVTRGQLSKIDAVAANHVFGWELLNPPSGSFSDVPPGSPFYTYIETVSCHGVVSGYSDGTFRPGNNAIRAQIAKIVCRTSQNPPDQCSPTATPGLK